MLALVEVVHGTPAQTIAYANDAKAMEDFRKLSKRNGAKDKKTDFEHDDILHYAADENGYEIYLMRTIMVS